MLELKGKYNTAKVFTDNIDAETILRLSIFVINSPWKNPKSVSCRIAMQELAVRLGQL